MPGTAWRASAIRLPGGPAPTRNGRQRRPGKRPGRRMLCGKTPGERTRRSSSRLRAGERFFRQRLHGSSANRASCPLNAAARAGRLLAAASGKRFFGQHLHDTRAVRGGRPLDAATMAGRHFAAASGGTVLSAASDWQAGESGRLSFCCAQPAETAPLLWTDRAKTGILALSL